jgi:hypothetical protein
LVFQKRRDRQDFQGVAFGERYETCFLEVGADAGGRLAIDLDERFAGIPLLGGAFDLLAGGQAAVTLGRFAQEKLVARDLVFAYRAGFREREIEAEAFADEKLESLAPDGEAAGRGGFFSGNGGGKFGESMSGGLEKGGKAARVFRKLRQLGFESFQKLHCAFARLLREFDPERVGTLYAGCSGAEEIRETGQTRLDGGEDLGGIFPGANEKFENGINGCAGVGLGIGAPAPEVALEKKFDPQMREKSATIQPGVAHEKRLGQGLNAGESFFEELDMACTNRWGIFAEERIVFSKTQRAGVLREHLAGLFQPNARSGLEV